MPSLPSHTTEHSILIAAPVKAVYGIIQDVTRWPEFFGPTVHAEYREQGPGSELIQIWATANDQVKTWVSRRWLDPAAARILFRQEVSQPPVAAMSGEWIFRQGAGDATQVLFRHEFSAVDNDQEAVAWIAKAVDENTTAELTGLKAVAEGLGRAEEVRLSFSDSLDIAGEVSDVYGFLRDAARWPDRLPHVASLELREEEPDIQLMAMATRTADGAVHDTYSIRVCLPPDRIVYKQTRRPRLMSTHTGLWKLSRTRSGTWATSHHVVVIDRLALTDVLGSSASLADAWRLIRDALGTNSRTTLACARDYAERNRLDDAEQGGQR